MHVKTLIDLRLVIDDQLCSRHFQWKFGGETVLYASFKIKEDNKNQTRLLMEIKMLHKKSILNTGLIEEEKAHR